MVASLNEAIRRENVQLASEFEPVNREPRCAQMVLNYVLGVQRLVFVHPASSRASSALVRSDRITSSLLRLN